jgi:hypothetical protein
VDHRRNPRDARKLAIWDAVLEQHRREREAARALAEDVRVTLVPDPEAAENGQGQGIADLLGPDLGTSHAG